MPDALSPQQDLSPEHHYDRLIAALVYDIRTYGPISPVAMLATVLEGMIDNPLYPGTDDADVERIVAALRGIERMP